MILIATDNPTKAAGVIQFMRGQGYRHADELLELHVNMIKFRDRAQLAAVLDEPTHKPITITGALRNGGIKKAEYEQVLSELDEATHGNWYLVDTRPFWFWEGFKKAAGQVRVILAFDHEADEPFDRLAKIADNILSGETVYNAQQVFDPQAVLDFIRGVTPEAEQADDERSK